jgi:hypothetical protein
LPSIVAAGLESFTLKNQRFYAQLFAGFLLAALTLGLTACSSYQIYKVPQYNYAGRPIPPSQLLQRVLASYTTNGTSGGLEILDGYRDLRMNVQNTIPGWFISGFGAGQPVEILSFPEQLRGYVRSYSDGSLTSIDYSKESATGSVANFGAASPSAGAAPDGTRFVGATAAAGQIILTDTTGTYALNLPNANKVAINQGNSVILAMVRNSNSLYRIVKLPATSNPVAPPGAVDCQPLLQPVYCVVPVAGTYDHPSNAYFSLDGNTVYILNCGPECAGNKASVTFLQEGALTTDIVPTMNPLAPGAPSPLSSLPVANPIPIPGGVTAALSDGTTLYLSGQSLFSLTSSGAIGTTPRADGLFTGYLTLLNLSTYAVSNPVSISDGSHSKMLFADDNTLWVGSQQCANGERQATGQNYNCLTLVQLGGATPVAQIIPNVTPGGSTTVPYPNTDENQYYYGSLTGICWVQEFHKVFTAYGGQIHAFYTGGTITEPQDPAVNTTPAAGTEINNTNITIQGTVLDVAYMDALTNSAN